MMLLEYHKTVKLKAMKKKEKDVYIIISLKYIGITKNILIEELKEKQNNDGFLQVFD